MIACRRLLPAAALLGAGTAIWTAAVASWRVAVIGAVELPANEAVLAVAAALLGAIAGATMAPRGRAFLLTGVGLVATAGAALAAAAFLPPRLCASPLGGLPTLGAPLLMSGLVIGALLDAAGRRAAAVLAGAGLAAGVALQVLQWWPPHLGFAAMAVGALLLVAAGAVVPALPRAEAVPAGRGLPAAGLLVGAMVVLMVQRGPGAAAMLAPTAVCCWFGALALGVGARLPAHQRARVVVAAMLVALLAGPVSGGGGIGLDLLVPAVAIGLLLAPGLAVGGAATLAAMELALAVGAALAGVGLAMELPPRIVLAAVSLLTALAMGRATATMWAVVAAAAGAIALQLAWPAVREIDADGETVLARAGCGAALYRAPTQEIALAVHGRDLDLAGPDHHHAALLVALTRVLAPIGELVVVGSGTGRIRDALLGLPAATSFVEPCAATVRLRGELAVDGPVLARQSVGMASGWIAGSREFAWTVERGSCAAIVCGEPLLDLAPARASIEEHVALRRAVGSGVVLQSFELERTAPELLATALAAAATVHPWCGVFLFGSTGIVCGLGGEPQLGSEAAAAAIAGLPEPLRWHLHAAGLGDRGDLADALLGALVAPASARGDDGLFGLRPVATVDPRGRTDANIAVLTAALGAGLAADGVARARLELAAARAGAGWQQARERLRRALATRPDSLLLARELRAAEVADVERRIAAVDPREPGQVADAATAAQRLLDRGGGSAIVQAALALPDRRGERSRTVAAAGAAALALDPGFAATAPAVLTAIVAALPHRSPLADFAWLPPPDRLAELAVGDSSLATALRGRFPSRCAAALVTRWAKAELSVPAQQALRQLADPFVLERARQALLGRGAVGELLQVWRADLPATAAIQSLASGPTAQRQALQVGCAGRTDPDSLELLRQGLLDDDLGVRTAAGAALFRSVGNRVGYDPEWPVDRRQAAAAQLAAINQRTP